MKKFTLLLMVAILTCLVMAVAVGCGDRNMPHDDNTQTQEPYEPTEEEIQAAIEKYGVELSDGTRWDDKSGVIFATLTREATLELKDYAANDFKELGECTVQNTLKELQQYVVDKSKGLPTEREYNIDVGTYQHTLIIKIEKPNLNRIIRACILLERRNDIEKARPDKVFEVEDNVFDIASVTSEHWLKRINIEEAWALTQGSEDVLVGVMDTGIDEGKMSVETTA